MSQVFHLLSSNQGDAIITPPRSLHPIRLILCLLIKLRGCEISLHEDPVSQCGRDSRAEAGQLTRPPHSIFGWLVFDTSSPKVHILLRLYFAPPFRFSFMPLLFFTFLAFVRVCL